MSPTLVLLHGIGGSAAAWAPLEAAFAGTARVLGWNAPGYGGRALPEELTFEGLAAQLIADLDAFGIEHAVLIGHSFGGMVAQQALKDFPNRVSGAVLTGTSPAFGNPAGDFQKKFVADRLAPLDAGQTLADMAGDMVAAIAGDDPDADGMALARRCMAEVPNETYRAVVELLVTFDRRDNLGAIACPVCLIAGEKDPNAPAAMMERMAGKIPGASFHMIPGAGHLAHLEQPQAFNRLVETFLERIADV